MVDYDFLQEAYDDGYLTDDDLKAILAKVKRKRCVIVN